MQKPSAGKKTEGHCFINKHIDFQDVRLQRIRGRSGKESSVNAQVVPVKSIRMFSVKIHWDHL